MLLAPCLTYWTLRLAGRIRLVCLRQAARPRVCNYEGFFPSSTVKCRGLCHGLEIFLKLGPDRMHARGKLESCRASHTSCPNFTHVQGKILGRMVDQKVRSGHNPWHSVLQLTLPALNLFDKPIKGGVYMHCLSLLVILWRLWWCLYARATLFLFHVGNLP